MSVDVEVYSSRSSSLAELLGKLPDTEVWERLGDELGYDADGWQVLLCEPEAIDPTEVPGDLAALLPDARYRYSLLLEPIGAPEDGYAFLASVLNVLGSDVSGVAYDLGTGAPRLF